MRNKAPYIVVAVLFLGYVLLELLGPKPMDWTPSYDKSAYTPFGSQLLYEGLADIFPEQEIRNAGRSPSKTLQEFESLPTNYIILAEKLDINQQDAHALLDFARRGNDVFLAADIFRGPFADSLGIENEIRFFQDTDGLFTETPKGESVSLVGEDKKYPVMDHVHYNYFDEPADAEVLGESHKTTVYPAVQANFLRFSVGAGNVYVHSVPLVFTNYYMVDPVNHDYISRCLSYLPNRPVLWDDYYKPGNVRLESKVAYLLDKTSLRWAWFLLLGTVVLFVLFQGKRRQRIVPTLEPVTNTTLEFTRNVSRLYYGQADHKGIADKKVKFFLEYVRGRWMIPTHAIDEDFQHRLAMKSGMARQDVIDLCQLIRGIQSVKAITPETLLLLNRKIETFYLNSQ